MKLNRKNKLLLVGFALALYISYSFAISNTILYYKDYQSKKESITTTSFSGELRNQLLQKETELNKLLSQYNVNSSVSFQNSLLKQLNVYSSKYHLKIIDFKEPHIVTEKNTTTSSYVFSLQGSFNGSVALTNMIESNPTLGSIKHVHFAKKRNYKSNLDELTVEVVLETIKM